MLELAQLGQTVHLVEYSLMGWVKDSSILTSNLEKLHYMIDSARGSAGGKKEGHVIKVVFSDPPDVPEKD